MLWHQCRLWKSCLIAEIMRSIVELKQTIRHFKPLEANTRVGERHWRCENPARVSRRVTQSLSNDR